MGLLGRILKNPVESQPEEQDEFNAEEKGLLMVPSLPGEQDGPSTAAAEDELDSAAYAESGPAEDAALPEVDPPEPAAATDTPDPQPAPGQEAQAEQQSSDDALDLFRAASVREGLVPDALKDDLKEVSTAELLAEARWVRGLLGGGASGAEGAGRKIA